VKVKVLVSAGWRRQGQGRAGQIGPHAVEGVAGEVVGGVLSGAAIGLTDSIQNMPMLFIEHAGNLCAGCDDFSAFNLHGRFGTVQQRGNIDGVGHGERSFARR